MADPTPIGLLPINVAFDRYVEGFGTNWDDDTAHVRAALADGTIQALVVLPNDADPRVVPPKSWEDYRNEGGGGVHFSERVFSSPEIVSYADGDWESLRNRTVFVSETGFDSWLSYLSDKFDPISESMWTLPMAVAWLSQGTRRAVRAQWPAYLSRTFRTHKPNLLGPGYVDTARQVMARWRNGEWLPLVTRRDGSRSRLSKDEAQAIELTLNDDGYSQ